MKRKTFFSYIGAIAVVLVVLVYMGYQVTTNLSQRIVTADAVEVTAEDKISTSGVFVRRETPVYAQAQGGTVEFLASDGEKVSKSPAFSAMKISWRCTGNRWRWPKRSTASITPLPIWPMAPTASSWIPSSR